MSPPATAPAAPRAWTPAERQIWLSAKGAPADVLLMTHREMAAIQGQCRQAMVVGAVQQAHIDGVRVALGPYADAEPDPSNGAGAARFDADRYKAAAEKALPLLDRLADTLGRMAGSKFIRFVVRYDLLGLAGECRMAAEFIRAQQALRRERSPLIDAQKIAQDTLNPKAAPQVVATG